jgi:transposase-like protein
MARTPSKKAPNKRVLQPRAKSCSMDKVSPTPKVNPFLSKYKPEYCEKILELAEDGKSIIQICVELGIHKDTYHQWVKDHSDFAKAAIEAKHISQRWWEQIGQECASGARKGDSKIWSMMMKNKFGYRDNPDMDKVIDKTVETKLSALIDLYKSKEKEY